MIKNFPRPVVWTRDSLGRAIQMPPDIKVCNCSRCGRMCVRRWYMSDPQVSELVDTGWVCVYGRHVDGRPVCVGCVEEIVHGH